MNMGRRQISALRMRSPAGLAGRSGKTGGGVRIGRFWAISWVLAVLATGLCPMIATAEERPPLVLAILIYNGFPDSTHRIGVQDKPGPVPARAIAIPSWLLDVPMTRSEAGALVSAIGAYITPDMRRKPRTPLDRAPRFERLLASLESCPGALASLTAKLAPIDDGGEVVSLLRSVRTERPEYAVLPDPDCRQ